MKTNYHEWKKTLCQVGTIALLVLWGAGCDRADNGAGESGQAQPQASEGSNTGIFSTAAVDVNPLGLSEEYRALLRSEMQQIQAAMQQLLPLMVQRLGSKAAPIAEQIHKSFILKQSLSPEELKELTGSLPKGFVKLDRSFHKTAKELSRAFQDDDYAEAARVYSKMVRSCVECHTSYAQKRFPPN